MALEPLELTKDNQSLARIVREHVAREETRLVYRRLMWLLAYNYLNGARRFDVLDPRVGVMQSHYLDKEGNLEFQSQDTLSAIDRVAGRLSAANLMPQVDRQGLSLEAIRERTIGQIIADSTVSEDQVDRVGPQFCHMLAALGSAGITGHVIDHQVVGLTADLEVIHPRELFPFPALGQDYTKTRGLLRQRVVPLSFLKKTFGRKIAENLDKIEWWTQHPAAPLQRTMTNDPGVGGSVTWNQGAGSMASAPGGKAELGNKVEDNQIGIVNIRELWLDGPRGTCSRYIVTSGDYTILDESYDDVEVYCPVGVARFIDTGTFHGAGLFDLLFSINRELERLLKSLFNNVRDIDKYGYIVMPAGSWNERSVLKEVGKGLRVVPYEPDVMGDNFKPFAVQPYNSGDMPGRVAQMAVERSTSLNPIKDLIEEKGRVDSAAGLAFLDEQIGASVTTATKSMRVAWGAMYRSVVQNAVRQITQSPRPLPVGRLTLDLAGAVIDMEKNEVSFPENPLPNVSRLAFSIRDAHPKSVAARKAEAVELMNLKTDTGMLIDGDTFRLFALKEGLDFAMYMDEHQAAWETVIRNSLVLYGDGQTPGQIVATPAEALPEFQLRVLTAFMGSPKMSMASPRVRDEFARYREFLMGAMSMVLPAAVPNPDDAAMLSQLGTPDGMPPGQGMGPLPPQQDPAMMQASGQQQPPLPLG